MENISSEEERPQGADAGSTAGVSAAYAPRQINPYVLPASIVFAAILISGSLIYLVASGGGGGDRVPKLENPFVPEAAALTEDDVVLGDPSAPVLVVEYGDYQCPYCGIYFTNVEPEIKERYVNTGQARFVFRNLAFLGEESVDAAMAAECAKDQNMFWQYHDALYAEEVLDFQKSRQEGVSSEHNGNLNRALFLDIAGRLNMDTAAFAECIDSEKYAEAIQEDNAQAAAIGVNSTPSTFVNGYMVVAEDAEGNPIPDERTGGLRGSGANGQDVFREIESALQN